MPTLLWEARKRARRERKEGERGDMVVASDGGKRDGKGVVVWKEGEEEKKEKKKKKEIFFSIFKYTKFF